MNLFSAEIYRERRSQLFNQVDGGIIWILGNEESPKNYRDNTYTFRQDSNFLYYGGISQPGLSLLLDLDSGDEFLCGHDPTVDDVVWTGPTPSLAKMAEAVGISKTLNLQQAEGHLRQACQSKRAIHFTPPYRGDNQIKIGDVLGISPSEVLRVTSRTLIEAIIKQRSIKQPVEIIQIEEALAITRAMHLEVMYETRPMLYEYDIMAKLLSKAHQNNVDTAYPVILTVNGQTLHNHHHHNQMQAGQLLLGDFGAESSMHYASDITRTLPVGEHFSGQQKEIYSLVQNMLDTAVMALSPGTPYLHIHLQAAEIMAEGLIGLGLMTGNAKEIVAEGAHALFFPHGLGHMLGLDVHDMEDLGEDLVGYDAQTERSAQFGTKSLRLGRALQPGFVLTVEPGIYFIPELIDLWRARGKFAQFINYDKLDAYRAFGGIRIEDNYLITENGSKLLGPSIPKTLEEVEFLRSIDKYTREKTID